MSEFWSYMAPCLIMAVLLPGWIVLWFKIKVTDEWAEGVIGDWADIEGVKVVAIDNHIGWYDRLLAKTFKEDPVPMFTNSNGTYKVYHVRVVDKKGRKRECKALVGRFLLGQTYRNISISWTKVPCLSD